MKMQAIRLWLRFWKWPKALMKLHQIRAMTAVHFNDPKFNRITKIIDE